MQLQNKSIKELKGILRKDYNVDLTEEQAQNLGISLLKLTRLVITALARKSSPDPSASVSPSEKC